MSRNESQLETAVAQMEELYVTKSFLPPMEEYVEMVKQLWESGRLTNNGKYLKQFESGLRDVLDNDNSVVVNNGTVALQIAIKAIDLTGEVITTPFSYVATTSSLVWEQCKPVFADIDPGTYNIDPTRIEEAITDRTTGILATHVFGNPCDVEVIQEIAQRRGLKVIYDAAHTFGVKYKGIPLVNYGDVSVLSFHATKLFHSVEGGAIVCKDASVFDRSRYMRNFGHDGEEAFHGIGINGKMSELHAAMGVLNLKYLKKVVLSRGQAWARYVEAFENHPKLKLQRVPEGTERNNAYFSLLFEDEETLLSVRTALNDLGVNPRRYFYPSLDRLPYVQGNSPVARDIAKRILCLPLFAGMADEDLSRVIHPILSTVG